MPFVGKIVKALSGEFLDRADLKQQLKVFMKVQKEMSENKNIDWVILREMFFSDCTSKDCDGKLKVILAPHDLFEWFKNKIDLQ